MEALQIREFLERVLPWPSPEDDGVISLHTSPHFKGVAVRTIDAFMKELDEAREENENIYFCTSQTNGAKRNGHDKLVPNRKQIHVVRCKSIFIDVDAKDYPSAKDATLALKKFLEESGLPPPTAIIASGSGGYHAYWSSNTPLIQGVWQQYADGLKALCGQHGLIIDNKCTTDSVRILRVPGTKNFKHKPAKPVWQVGELGPEYDFATALASLAEAKSVAKASRQLVDVGRLSIPERFKGRKDVITVPDEQLPAGFPPMTAKVLRKCLDRIPNTKVDWSTWNTTGMRVFAACDGEDYGLAEWQRWSDTLNTESKDTCESRWTMYHTSPPTRTGAGALINEVRRITGEPKWLPVVVTPAQVQLAKGEDPEGWHLPSGYRLKDKKIERYVAPKPKKKKDDDHDDDDGKDDPEDPWRPFIKNEIICKPWAQKGPDGIMLHIRIDVATTREVFIASTDCPRTKIIQKMCEVGVWFETHTPAMFFEGFFMDWIGRMNSFVAANEKACFGWEWGNPESKLPTAFVYGGDRYKNNGTKEPVGAIDKQMRDEYYPQGKPEVWDEAAKVIFDQHRPALELIVAATLAGPLVQFTGVEGCMLSVHSNSSGAHKSTASKLGAAIFGHPVDSRQTKGSSAKGALKRAGDLRHLTIQFDDLQDDKDLLTATLVALQLAQGHEGDKLNQKREYAAKGKWQTFSMTLSNQSVVDFVIRKEPNTPAQLNRIFEVYHTKQANNDPGMIDEGVATRLIGELSRNFGHVGRRYASMLACNVETIEALVIKEQEDFRATIVERGIEGDSANRYWMFTCTVLLAATKLGRELGIPFDYDGIRALLVESFLKNSNKRTDEAVDGESVQNTELAVSEFLNTVQATNVLWTNTFAMRGGADDKLGPPLGTPPTGRPTWVHFSTKRRLVRISQKAFKALLREEKRNPRVVMEGLAKHFNADLLHRYILGAGTSFAGIQEKVIEIPIPEGSPFETMMFAHGGKADEQI
jgi:hypothetical protein